MKEQKEYNEYGDKLVTLDVAKLAFESGYKYDSPECYAYMEHTSEDKPIITDEWSGQIPDGFRYLCDRPTQSALQKWLREIHEVYMYVSKSKYFGDITSSASKKYEIYVDRLFVGDNDDFENALEDGLYVALKQLVK